MIQLYDQTQEDLVGLIPIEHSIGCATYIIVFINVTRDTSNVAIAINKVHMAIFTDLRCIYNCSSVAAQSRISFKSSIA